MNTKDEEAAVNVQPTVEEAKPDAAGADALLVEILAETSDAAATQREETQREQPLLGLRTARLLDICDRHATIVVRGQSAHLHAVLAEEVDTDILEDARNAGDLVLVEGLQDGQIEIVGVLHTRRPREIHLRAAKILIEGDEEVTLRSGRGAARISAEGDIEILGTRIRAVSRGLFRIVGKILRLN